MSNNAKPLVPDYILRKLVLLYGFNEFFLQKKNIITLEQSKELKFEKFYLINKEWINKFKLFYNYESISNLIKSQNSFHFITYDQFKNNIDNIIIFLKTHNICQIENNFPDELKGRIAFVPQQIRSENDSIFYFKEFYIVNEKINNELCQDDKNQIMPNYSKFNNSFNFNFFICSNSSFFYDKDRFEIGIIDKEGIFIPQYHIVIDEKGIKPEDEIKIILQQKSIDNYFKLRNINKEKKESQNLLVNNKKKIGKILFIDINYNNYQNQIIGNMEMNETPNPDESTQFFLEKFYYNNQKLKIQNNNINNFKQNNNNMQQSFFNNIQNQSINQNVNNQQQFYNNNNQNQFQQNNNQSQKQNNNYIFNQNNLNPNMQQNINQSVNKNSNINFNPKTNDFNIQYQNQNFQNIGVQQNFNNNNQMNNNFNNNNQMNLNQMNNNQMNNNQMNNNQMNNNLMNNNQMNLNQMNNNSINNNQMNNNLMNNNQMNLMNNNQMNLNQMNNNSMNKFNLSQQNFFNNNQKQFMNQNSNNNNINNYTQNNFYNKNQLNNQPQQVNQKPLSNANEKCDNSNLTSLKQFNYVPLIGLNNIGQTCYMNSVLQCFSNLYYITNYFLNPSKKKYLDLIKEIDKETPSLANEYKELIEKLWKGKPNVPYSPIKFKETLGKLNSLFEEEKACDSKDLICFLIMKLHEELNNKDNDIKAPLNINQNDEKIDPYDNKKLFQAFCNDFALNHNSIITQYFYGTIQSIFECQVCKMNRMRNGIMTPLLKYNYQNIFYLEFPLDEVRKFVMNQYNNMGMNLGMNYQKIEQVNIIDCFNYYQKQESIEGYCEKCGSNNAQILNETKIYLPPNILIIAFNRGQGLQYDIKVNFPENLDLTKTILNNTKIYELQSVIKHFGDNSSSGHFIAYCRSPIPKFHNLWYCYNDAIVVQTNKWSDIHDNGVTYILFYQLKLK